MNFDLFYNPLFCWRGMGGGKGGNQVFHENAVFEVSSFVSAGTHRFCSIHIHLHTERARERDDNNAHSPGRRGSS